MCRLIQEVMFCGSVVAPAMVAPNRLGSKKYLFSLSIFFLLSPVAFFKQLAQYTAMDFQYGCFSSRFSSISLILGAHQQLHWSLVQTEDAVLDFNRQMPSVLFRTISVHTHSNMEMAVVHPAIMYLTC
jgi:hypothetical protein